MITEVSRDVVGIHSRGRYPTMLGEQLENDILEFANSGFSACEVSNPGYKDVHSFYVMARRYAEKSGLSIGVVSRKGRIYLVRGEKS